MESPRPKKTKDGPRRPLTQVAVRALRDEGTYKDGIVKGLYFKIYKGTRSWVYGRQVNGKRYWIVVGSDVSSIADVRKRASTLAAMTGEELIASQQLKVAPKKVEKVMTFHDAAEEYLAWNIKTGRWSEERSKTPDSYRRAMREILYPLLGDRPLKEITPKDVAAFITEENAGRAYIAKDLRYVRQIFDWAAANGQFVGINPGDKRGPLKFFLPKMYSRPTRNQGAIPVCEIPDFFASFYVRSLSRPTVACFLFSILTATRSLTVRSANWEDIDWESKTWHIPADDLKVKSNGGLVVPLSPQALSILRQQGPQKTGLIFTGPTKSIFSDAIFTEILKKEALAGKEWIDVEQSRQLKRKIPARQHGIARATFRTWSQDDSLGNDQRFSPMVAELCLHHAVPDAYFGAYERNRMMERRREMMDAWGAYCFSKIEKEGR